MKPQKLPARDSDVTPIFYRLIATQNPSVRENYLEAARNLENKTYERSNPLRNYLRTTN